MTPVAVALEREAIARARALEPQVIAWRRALHQIPEPGFGEFQTAQFLDQVLRQYSVRVVKGDEAQDIRTRMSYNTDDVKGAYDRAIAAGMDRSIIERLSNEGTACIAEFGAAEGPVVGVRVDMDALPIEEAESDHLPFREGFRSRHAGYMHACGHDGHMALGLGLIATLAPLSNQLEGRVKVFFQPAEEGCRGGARAIVSRGAAADLDYLLAVHIGLGVPSGTVVGGAEFMATSKYRALFSGSGAHVTNAPQEGANALLAAAHAALALHAIAPHSKGWFSLNVGVLRAGTEQGVTPAQASMELGYWTEASPVSDYLQKKVFDIIQAAAAMHNCTVVLDLIGKAPSARPDEALIETVLEAAHATGARDAVRRQNCRAGEDATELMRAAQERGGKATYVILGSDLPSGHHTPRFDFDERVLEGGVALLASTVLRLLRNGSGVNQMRSDSPKA